MLFPAYGRVRAGAQHLLRTYALHRPPELEGRLRELAELAAAASDDLYAHRDLTRYERRVFSQNGEDGVLVEIFNRVGVHNRHFVEFGVQDGTEGNAVLWADVFGWAGLFVEAAAEPFDRLRRKYAGTRVVTTQATITADNVNDVFAAANVPSEFDLLSIDIDGNDLYVWEALIDFSPRVVVIEYNAGIDPSRPLVQPHRPDRAWDGTGAYGANLAALDVVAARHGYQLAHTDLCGVNAFYVRADLWPSLAIDRAPRRTENHGLTGLGHRPATPDGGWREP